jgi:hypothetical protein
MLKSRFDALCGPTLVVSASVFELLALTCRHSSRDSAVEFDIVTCIRWLWDFYMGVGVGAHIYIYIYIYILFNMYIYIYIHGYKHAYINICNEGRGC